MFPFYYCIIIFSIVSTIFELYKRYREYKTTLIKEVPKDIQEIYGDEFKQDEFEKSQNYKRENLQLTIIATIVDCIGDMIIIGTSFLPYLWKNVYIRNDYITSMIFVLVIEIIQIITSLPFKIYRTFVIREKYEMNKMSVKVYLKDMMKNFMISYVLNFVMISVLYVLQDSNNLCFYLTIVVLILNIFITLILVPVILPMFYTVKPLENEEMKNKLESKMKEVGFSIKNIKVIDSSKKQKEGNAFFTGLFGKRDLVIYDTLMNTSTEEEMIDIVLHEVGHCKHKHIYKQLIIGLIQVYCVMKFIEMFIFEENLYEQFGFDHKIIVVGFSLLEMLLEPFMEIVNFLENIMIRKFEYQADEYATRHGYHKLGSALIKLQKNNLGSYIIDPFVSAIEHSHPTIVERIRAMNKIIEKEN